MYYLRALTGKKARIKEKELTAKPNFSIRNKKELIMNEVPFFLLPFSQSYYLGSTFSQLYSHCEKKYSYL
jgi:hypothetical protein